MWPPPNPILLTLRLWEQFTLRTIRDYRVLAPAA